MAILPRWKRLKRRDWKDPFSWFNWYHQNKRDPVFLYRPESGRTGMIGFTNTRADSTTCARYRDSSGIWQTAAANVLRDAHYHYDGTSQYRTLLREGAGTNSAPGSCSFADNTYWNGAAAFTLAAVTSCISGTTARKHTDTTGANGRGQDIGAFVNAQTDCFSWIVENDATVPATTSRLGVYDTTAGAFVHRVELTWSNLALSTLTGSGTSGVIDLGTGPNGGRLVRVWITATGTAAGTGAAGNTRTAYIYPSVQANKATIAHHAQFEAATSYPSSPIVTVAGAVTRAADDVTVSWSRVPEAGTWYIDFYELGTIATASNYLLMIGKNSTTDTPRMYIDAQTNYRLVHQNGVATKTSLLAAAPTFGQRCELAGVLSATGSVKLSQSINSAAVTAAAESAANTFAAAWATPTVLDLSFFGSSFSNIAIRSILYVPGPEQSMASMREIVRQ